MLRWTVRRSCIVPATPMLASYACRLRSRRALTAGTKTNVIPCNGGAAGTPGFYNDQTAAALADAAANLVVGAAVPNVVSTLTPAALEALSGRLLAAGAWRLRWRR